MTKRFQSTCYYVKDEKSEAWGYFTVTPEIGLLQIHCVYLTFSESFSYRWNAPGSDFKQFLIRMGPDYLADCLEGICMGYAGRRTETAYRELKRRINKLLSRLWPLFIEQLKAEMAEAGVA